jgi:hypothetical protein
VYPYHCYHHRHVSVMNCLRLGVSAFGTIVGCVFYPTRVSIMDHHTCFVESHSAVIAYEHLILYCPLSSDTFMPDIDLHGLWKVVAGIKRKGL